VPIDLNCFATRDARNNCIIAERKKMTQYSSGSSSSGSSIGQNEFKDRSGRGLEEKLVVQDYQKSISVQSIIPLFYRKKTQSELQRKITILLRV
jgi:hypothetical protein